MNTGFFSSTFSSFKKGVVRRTDTLNRVELSADALRHNFTFLNTVRKGVCLFPVVKGNAYGHGLPEIARLVARERPPYIAVDNYYEALVVREHTRSPILILGDNNPNNIRAVASKRFTFGVTNARFLRAVADIRKPITIHIALNTGMNREGFQESELADVITFLKEHPLIHVEGLSSHFADADGEDLSFTRKQEETFTRFLDIFESAGINPKWIHLGNSAGFLKTTDRRINALRSGIALYGINPLLSNDAHFPTLQSIRPVLRLLSTIVDIQELKRGDAVGYNCTYEAREKCRVGLLPLGYHEALDRRLSNTGCVEYGGALLPIVGRVSMNLTSIDLGGSTATSGDEVVVISNTHDAPHSVGRIASTIGTIPYEVLARIHPSIRRVIV